MQQAPLEPPTGTGEARLPWEEVQALQPAPPPATPSQQGPVASGSIVPISRDAEGNTSFDSDAGIVGLAKRVLMAPGDAFQGEFAPGSPEAHRRALEFALTVSPTGAASRAMPSGTPGSKFRKSVPKAPTESQLKEAAGAGYKSPSLKGVDYKGSVFKKYADDVISELDEAVILDSAAPKTRDALNALRSPPDGSFVKLQAADQLRRTLNKIAGTPDKTEASAANIAIRRLDEVLATPRPVDLMHGSKLADDAIKTLTEARGNAAAGFRSERLSDLTSNATRRAATANSGQNIGNTLRQRVASLLENAKKSRGFNQEEIALIEKVADGTVTTNGLRRLSNLLGGGGGLGQTLIASLGAGIGGSLGGPAGAAVGLVPVGVGAGARTLANKAVRNQLGRVGEAVRMRSPLYQELLNSAPMIASLPEGKALLARMLTAAPINQGAKGKPPMTADELKEFLRQGGA